MPSAASRSVRRSRFFGEGKYVRAKAHTFAQPSFDFFTLLFPDNAYLNNVLGDLAPNGAFVTGRDNFDFGIRRASTERRTIRTVLGADGRITDNLRYELSYTFGQTKSSTNNQNDRLTDRYFAALDAVVDPATGQITCRINFRVKLKSRASAYPRPWLVPILSRSSPGSASR